MTPPISVICDGLSTMRVVVKGRKLHAHSCVGAEYRREQSRTLAASCDAQEYVVVVVLTSSWSVQV